MRHREQMQCLSDLGTRPLENTCDLPNGGIKLAFLWCFQMQEFRHLSYICVYTCAYIHLNEYQFRAISNNITRTVVRTQMCARTISPSYIIVCSSVGTETIHAHNSAVTDPSSPTPFAVPVSGLHMCGIISVEIFFHNS